MQRCTLYITSQCVFLSSQTSLSLYFWPYSSHWLLWIITSRDLACCYLCLWAHHWRPLLAAVWIAAGFSRAVESDLLRSIFYSRPQWPGALCSSWNTLLCDRCHIKQRSPRHQPASKILPLSLCSGLSARLTPDCICVCVCVNQRDGGLAGRQTHIEHVRPCLHLNTYGGC